jgi:hypothetical protein
VLDRALYDGVAEGLSDGRFECEVLPTLEHVESNLRDRIDAGFNARIVAGFFWPWSDALPSGQLVPDVQIGTWTRPWNRKANGQSYPADRHPYAIWASRRSSQIDEAGCIYSTQGFEFDYVEVIWGIDLVWRTDRWIAEPSQSFHPELSPKRGRVDPVGAEALIKNAYRVLCTRALRPVTKEIPRPPAGTAKTGERRAALESWSMQTELMSPACACADAERPRRIDFPNA